MVSCFAIATSKVSLVQAIFAIHCYAYDLFPQPVQGKHSGNKARYIVKRAHLVEIASDKNQGEMFTTVDRTDNEKSKKLKPKAFLFGLAISCPTPMRTFVCPLSQYRARRHLGHSISVRSPFSFLIQMRPWRANMPLIGKRRQRQLEEKWKPKLLHRRLIQHRK